MKLKDLEITIDKKELVILTMDGSAIEIRLPINSIFEYRQIKRKRGEKKKDFLKRAKKLKPKKVELLINKG